MILELHSHTSEHSACSHIAACDLIRHCISKKLQGLVLTDHHYLWKSEALADLLKACRVPDHFIVLAGQEVRTSDLGDVLVYGAGETIQEGTPVGDIAGRFPEAALVLAHPYRNGRMPHRHQLLHPSLHAIEIFNANQSVAENIRALQDWHRYRFTAVAGTDIHALDYCGTYPTVFDHPIDSIQSLGREIRSGRCRPFLSEIPRSGASSTQVTELRIGSSCRAEDGDGLIVKRHRDRAHWQTGHRTQQIMKAFVDSGFGEWPFRVPVPLDRDERDLLAIEEGIAGATLFDELIKASGDRARILIRSTALWLAALHRKNLRVTPAEEFLAREPGRIERYLSILYRTGNPHTRRIQQIADAVSAYESQWFDHRPERLIQGHGDFHPKNILIGSGQSADPNTVCVAAIDFQSSYQLPRAYDVGTFLAQYENQLRPHPQIPHLAPPELFLESYAAAAGPLPDDFRGQVDLFKARTALSIMHYLVKVGLGESRDLWQVLLSAEKSLVRIGFRTTSNI